MKANKHMVRNNRRPNLKFLLLVIVFPLNLMMGGCATLGLESSEEREESRDSIESSDVEAPQNSEEPSKSAPEVGLSPAAAEALEKLIDDVEDGVESASTPSPEGAVTIPVELNQSVKKWINYFSKKDKERFQRFLSRGEKYKEVVQSVLKDNGVPQELYYLAMIESGYVTHARSHAKAVGVWQFIRGTADRYGLEVNYFVDERRDPIRATEAAAKYLSDLYNAFQSWYLAMAAYNTGEYRILSAIINRKSRDYWTLVKKKALPRETRNYIPKFLAAVVIGRDPEKYGFHLEKDEDFPSVEAVEMPSPIRLATVAKLSGVPLATLKKVNPHIRRGITSPNSETYELWVPEDRIADVKNQKEKLASLRLKGLRVGRTAARRSSGGGGKIHKVRRGESLYTIARRYNVSIGYLKRINGLRGSRIHIGQRLRTSARSYKRQKASVRKVKPSSGYHVVRRGDTLVGIASKYGLSTYRLKKINGLSNSRIYPGQKLKVVRDAQSYRVRKGDSLFGIAKRFGVSVASIKKRNGLRKNRIFIGQKLKIN